MQDYIRGTIVDAVSGYRGQTGYRTPLVGFARADDPGFARLQEVVGRGHLLPQDLLPGASAVVAFFVPFREELVRLQREDRFVNRAWAEAYIETNRLIYDICGMLAGKLAGNGIRAAWQQPTHNFDRSTLVSPWSHKHVAFLCGLGSFGRNQMLITASGCAGRLGSLVLDAGLPAAPVGSVAPSPELCLAKAGRSCDACIRRCPSGALTETGLDKRSCFKYLQHVNKRFQDLGHCLVCGKCATGPCALKAPGADEGE